MTYWIYKKRFIDCTEENKSSWDMIEESLRVKNHILFKAGSGIEAGSGIKSGWVRRKNHEIS